MTIELIEAFLALTEHKNFVSAAKKLYISQSSLSHRINLLESELNIQLIARSRGKREFSLTQAGIEFMPIAERWHDLAKETLNFKSGRGTPTLTVASIETISFVLSNLYRQIIFADSSQPHLYLETHTYPSPQIITEVEDQNVDIGFTVRYRVSKRLRIEPIFKEKHYLIASFDSEKEVLDPRSLNPRKEIITDWSPDYQMWHDSYLGSNAHPLAAIDTATLLSHFMEDGAWCIVPESSIPFLQKNCPHGSSSINVFRMPFPPPDRICYKVTSHSPRPSRMDAIHRFEALLNTYLQTSFLIRKADMDF